MVAAVFIVDDDEAVRHSLTLLLEAHGRAVRAFASVAEFLSECDAVGEGCLLVDHHMPGMTGLDLIEALKSRGLLIPTILLTGNPTAAVRAGAAKAGATILEKPIADDELIAALDALKPPDRRS